MDAETAPAAPKRRIIFWTVVALVGAIMLAVVGALVFSFVNAEQLVDDPGGGLAAYLTVFGLVFADAIVPKRSHAGGG